jgi:transposase-like protein
MKLSVPQRIMKFFSSEKRFEAIKKESMEWQVECPECKAYTSIWDLGGVRYRDAGNPKMRLKCPKCDANIIAELKRFTD